MSLERPLPCTIQSECGGCPSMGRSVADQRARRLSWMSRAIGHPAETLVPSPRQLGYRARVRLSPDESGRLGFHPPRSHEVLPIQSCPVAHAALAPALAALPAVPREVGTLELRTDGERVVAAVQARRGAGGRVRTWAEKLDPTVLGGADLAVDGKPVRGDCRVVLTVGGITHQLSAETFYQVNLEVNAQLVTDVGEAVRARAPTQVLDAFSGAGNLSLPLAVAGIHLTLIESHAPAVRDARATAKRHGLTVDARVGRAQDFCAGDAFFDLAIVDPPRAGAGPMMGQLLLTRPAALVMVSCNPHTLSRDLRQATEAGYQVSLVRVYEMFPQTEHAEVLVVLDR